MKVGIVGTGFGAFHCKILSRMERVEGITIFGRNPEKLEKLSGLPRVETTRNIEDILGDPGIGLVDVCVPTPLHAEFVDKALASGKAVFCETPFSESAAEAAGLCERARQAGLPLMVDMFVRFSEAHVYLRERVRDRRFGTLRSLRMERTTPPLWGDMGLRRMPVHLMIHELDILAWTLGAPDSIEARGREGTPGRSSVDCRLRYRGLEVGLHAASDRPETEPFMAGYRAEFDDAVLTYRVESGPESEVEHLAVESPEGRAEVTLGPDDCYALALGHALDCLAGSAAPEDAVEPRLSAEDALVSVRMACAIRDAVAGAAAT